MVRDALDGLAGLVALAGDQQQIVGAAEGRHTDFDGDMPTVGDLGPVLPVGRNAAQDLRPDRVGLLAARVVVGDDSKIGQPGGDLAHDRPLAAVTIAATTEHHDELAAREGTERTQHGLQRLRLVGIIDIDGRTRPMAGHELQSAWSAGQTAQPRHGPRRIAARRHHEAESREGIGRLEAADQREVDLMAYAQDFQRQMLAGRRRIVGQQTDVTALRAIGPEPDAATRADCGECLGAIAVGIRDRRAFGRQQAVEQPRLGLEVGIHRRMIVEVFVREVGEGRRREPNAIEAMLVETVARCFDREMADALARKRGQILVELDGIGGREAGFARQSRRDDAKRAHTCRLETERRPKLAYEMNGRGLAIGAGDRPNGLGLQTGERRRHQRHATARVGVAQHGNTGIERRQRSVGCGENRHGAATHRIGDERRTIVARSRQCREQVAGPDLARIEGQASENRIAQRRGKGRGFICAPAHELTQPQRDALPLGGRTLSALGQAARAEPCAAQMPDGARLPARTAVAPPVRGPESRQSPAAAAPP